MRDDLLPEVSGQMRWLMNAHSHGGVLPVAQTQTQSLGVFKNNREKPFHRWYPFVEGYSADLVSDILGGHPSPGNLRVFDPFGGSGTTVLAAATAGADSVFAEVNPYLAFVTDTKVNQARLMLNDPQLPRLAELATRIEARASFPMVSDHPLIEADGRRGFFPDGVAGQAAGLLGWIETELTGPAAALAKLACATSLVPSSNMIRRTDLRRRTPRDPKPLGFGEKVVSQLRAFYEDIVTAGDALQAGTAQVAADVRTLEPLDEEIHLVVTSPPYLNGTNYSRNTKLELLALRFVESESELARIRTEAVTAGINYVSSRRPSPRLIPAVEEIALTLDAVAYDRRIPALVRGYFSDMWQSLERVRRAVSDGARFVLDIGDSRFCGVHIPTDILLAGVAEQAGWRVRDSKVLRSRRSYDGGELRQVLLEMVAA